MATIQKMFINELLRLLDDYDRCPDDLIKIEIQKDIELYKEVLFGEKTDEKKSMNNIRQFKAVSRQIRNEA